MKPSGSPPNRFSYVFESVNDGLFYLTKIGIILEANKKAVRLFGGPEKKLIGSHFTKLDLFPMKGVPVLLKHFKKAFAGKLSAKQVKIKNQQGELNLSRLPSFF